MAQPAGHDVTRIEAFSDAVFGFAITLLVVSLEVPNSFDELLRAMKSLPVFAVTFAILLMIWQEHHNLFKRFPSSDGVTIWLNGGLLFVVLTYVYPLKFLFTGIVGPGGTRFGQSSNAIRLDQMVTLMIVYGAGFAAIFLLFAAMYWRASRRVTDPLERHDARVAIGHSFVYVFVAGVSMVLALFGGDYASAYSGVAYGLTGPMQGLYHGLTGRYWKPPTAAGTAAPVPEVSPESPGAAPGAADSPETPS
jgi:uncharacterized membrane protein